MSDYEVLSKDYRAVGKVIDKVEGYYFDEFTSSVHYLARRGPIQIARLVGMNFKKVAVMKQHPGNTNNTREFIKALEGLDALLEEKFTIIKD